VKEFVTEMETGTEQVEQVAENFVVGGAKEVNDEVVEGNEVKER
jgi:hypothetical protein